VVLTSLTALHDLIACIAEEPKKTKEIMYSSIKEYIHIALPLFSVYINESGNTLLSAYVACLIGRKG